MATVLTDVGEAWIVTKINVATKAEYVGWGTGAGTAAKADTTLSTEAAETRVAGTITTSPGDHYTVVSTLTSASAQTITNAGLFTAVTGPSLIIHGDFTGIPLGIGDKIEFTMDLEIT